MRKVILAILRDPQFVTPSRAEEVVRSVTGAS
jgi:hypothetical protein